MKVSYIVGFKKSVNYFLALMKDSLSSIF